MKVVDFGLAKFTDISDTETAVTMQAHTEEGTVLGTAAYMSPEQAEGKQVDARSDIFSFGVMLYEMVSGRHPFRGESRVSTLAALLSKEPPPLAVTGLPKELDRIVQRCLRKDPERRFQLMKECRIALEELKEESDSGRLAAAALPAVSVRGRKFLWLAVAAAVVVAGFTASIVRSRRAQPAAPIEYRLRQLTADSGYTTTPAISPDGRFIAYAADRSTQGTLDIWVQPLTEGSRPIRLTTDPSDDLHPTFSPDGGLITFYSKRSGGSIMVVPSLGGDERVVARGKVDPFSRPRFSPDGRSIAYATGSPLSDSQVMITPVSGGTSRPLDAGIGWASSPAWSPDGSHILMAGLKTQNEGSIDAWVAPAGGGAAVNLGPFPGGPGVEWIGNTLIYSGGSAVWSREITPGVWKLGTPRRLFSTTAMARGVQGIASKDSLPARIVFSSESGISHLWSLALDSNSGRVRSVPVPVPYSAGSQVMPSMSRNGAKLIYTQADPGGAQLRLRDLATGKESVLLSEMARGKLSPDGSEVAYTSYGPKPDFFLIDASGGDAIKLLENATDRVGAQIYDWTHDGNHLVFCHGSPIRFGLLNPRTRQSRELISHPKLNIHGAEISPDGRWVAFHVPGTAREPLYIAALRDGRATEEADWILVTNSPGYNRRPWWSDDGDLLYYLSERDVSPAIWAQRLNPSTKQPQGEPFAIQRFPETRRNARLSAAAQFGPAIAKDRIIYSLQEMFGNIWIAEVAKLN